jgi:hypothetical protein
VNEEFLQKASQQIIEIAIWQEVFVSPFLIIAILFLFISVICYFKDKNQYYSMKYSFLMFLFGILSFLFLLMGVICGMNGYFAKNYPESFVIKEVLGGG